MEYYQEASDLKKEEETFSSTVPSADSIHATDTNFKISSNVNSTSQSSTEDSMPVIEMPKIKYQLRSLKKFQDMEEKQKSFNEEEEEGDTTLSADDDVTKSARSQGKVPDATRSDKKGTGSKSEISELDNKPKRQQSKIAEGNSKHDVKTTDKQSDKQQSKKKEEGSRKSEISDITNQPKPDTSSSSPDFTDGKTTRGSNKTNSAKIKEK